MCFEPLAVDAAAVHDARVAWFHPVGDPAFGLDAEFIDQAVTFCLVETVMELPAMRRGWFCSFFVHLPIFCMGFFLLIVFGKIIFFLRKTRKTRIIQSSLIIP